jgi:hypothetical protein
MNQSKYIGLFVTIFLALLAGCAFGGNNQFAAGEPAVADVEFEAPAEGMAEETVEEASTIGYSANQVDIQERLIIRDGEVYLVVDDTEAVLNEIAGMTVEAGGWVVSSNVFQRSSGIKSGEMRIRVPVEAFDAMLSDIQALAIEVERVSTSGEDVTEEYVDLQARLGNLEATADRVRNFLDETRNVEEALAVNQELSRLESDIESMKARIQFLEESAAFSSIFISLTPDELSQPIEVGGWRPVGVARDALQALVGALQGLATIGIWLVIVVLPLALIVILPVSLIAIWWRRRRRRQVTAAE